MFHSILSARVLAFVVTATVAISAGAAGQRSFVASNGNDTHPCTLAQPCRGFAAAVTNTNSGGEVIVLDSAGYGPVTITKSITIASPAGVYAGITVFAGDGVTVDGANIIVVLRGLSINNQGGDNGVVFVQGEQLVLQDSELAGFASASAISASAPNSVITVRNSTLRRSARGFQAINSVVATLDGVRMYDNTGFGVLALTGSKVTVANSVIANSSPAAQAASLAAGLTDLTVTRTVIARSDIAISALALPGGTARVVSDGNTIAEALEAFHFYGSGGTELIYTAGNNSVGFVVSPVVGGALTSCCGI
jgi:Right handed beta helix region